MNRARGSEHRSGFSTVVLVVMAFFAGRADAAYLDEFHPAPGSKIGVFIGTFDPIHERHRSIIERSLTEGGLDYVVVLPNDLAPHKPDASAFLVRVKMIGKVFGSAEKVIVPRGTVDGFGPIGGKVLRSVGQSCPTCIFYGIKGSDTAADRMSRLLDGIFLSRIKKWIFLERDEATTATVRESITRDSNRTLIRADFAEASSTAIRKWFTDHPEFYDRAYRVDPNDLPPYLSPDLFNLIRENHLYDPRAVGGHPIFSVPSFDPDRVQWKSGQLIGLSDRSGRSPFVVQAGTHSPIDHVAVVSVEPDGVYAFEFTNGEGIAKTPIALVLDRARGKSGHLMAVVAEPRIPLGPSAFARATESVARLMDAQRTYGIAKIPGGPKSCSQFVQSFYASAGRAVGRTETIDAFDTAAFGGFIGRNWSEILLDSDKLLSPRGLFTREFRVIHSNLPSDLNWTPAQVLQTWTDEGDLSKIVRGLAVKERRPLRTETEIADATKLLVAEFEASLAADLRKECALFMQRMTFHP